MSIRLETVHAQLGSLLDNAQTLLAESLTTHGHQRHQTVGQRPAVYSFLAMQAEIRTLEFWRSIIAECVATFFYTMIVLSVGTSNVTDHTIQTNCAIAAGLAMVIIVACFSNVSGANANPAITLAMVLTKNVSPLRAVLYICAQCGGGIAGAALVYGVHKRLVDVVLNTDKGAFGMEFVLTFLVTYAFCASKNFNFPTQTHHHLGLPSTSYQSNYHSNYNYNYSTSTSTHRTTMPIHAHSSRSLGAAPPFKANPVIVGIAYAGALFAWKGSLNPARALGSAFVNRNEGRFKNHWIFWVAPMLGAITAAFVFEFIFNPRRRSLNPLNKSHGDNISIHSDTDMIDDLERAKQYKANILQDFNDPTNTNTTSMYGQTTSSSGIMQRNYNKRNTQPYGTTTNMNQQSESLYGGSKSMYNQSIYDSSGNAGVGSKSVYGDMSGNKSTYGDMSSRSMYDGYDGVQGRDRNNPNLRRAHSVSTKIPMPQRRNPYDYLPDEPNVGGSHYGPSDPTRMQQTTTMNKPDIMQSVGPTKTSPRSAYSPTQKYQHDLVGPIDNYTNEKLDSTTAVGQQSSPYRGKVNGGPGLVTMASGPGGTNLNGPQTDPLTNTDPIYDYNKNGFNNQNRSDYQRRSHMTSRPGGPTSAGGPGSDYRSGGPTSTSGGPGGSDYYSSQYNASYSQRNGCSITPNSVASYHSNNY